MWCGVVWCSGVGWGGLGWGGVVKGGVGWGGVGWGGVGWYIQGTRGIAKPRVARQSPPAAVAPAHPDFIKLFLKVKTFLPMKVTTQHVRSQ